MGSKSIPGGPSEPEPPLLEEQQRLLLVALHRAHGAPVSYEQLREAGIEFPASVVSELELAGLPIERCHGGAAGGRGTAGVRLRTSELEPGLRRALETAPRRSQAPHAEPDSEPEPIPVATGRLEGAGVSGRRSRRTPGKHVLAPLALLAVTGTVAVLALTGVSGGTASTRTGVVHRRHGTPRALAASHTQGANTVATTSTAAVAPTPVSPALATQLESEGHAMLEAGQYAGAVPVLRRALQATGETSAACLEPASSTCLTYAYALYDLGRALRLSGDSAAAVPILESRLQIDNQRPSVAAELQLALQQAGGQQPADGQPSG